MYPELSEIISKGHEHESVFIWLNIAVTFNRIFFFQGYDPLFIHKIKHKHILAKNYFSQIPVLASFITDDAEIEEIRKKYQEDTKPKVIEPRMPSP